MYFLNYKQLAEDLRDCKVSEKQKFNYLIATMIIFSIIYTSRLMPYDGDITMALIADVLTLLMIIIGLVIIYQKNQQGDGKHFLERYLCLGFPISIIGFFIGIIISGIILAIILMIFGQESMKNGNIMGVFSIASSILMTLFTFFLFYDGIRMASTTKK